MITSRIGSTGQPITHTTALNGYWERMRKLLRMLGADPLPAGLVGVVIAGDTREAGATTGAYRRFGATMFIAGPIAVDTPLKFRFDVDVVIDGFTLTHQTGATSPAQVRLLTAAEVVADAAAVYTSMSVNEGSWIDNPDGSPIPVSRAQNGATAIGRAFFQDNTSANQLTTFAGQIFLPAGAALYFRWNNNAATSIVCNIQGFTKN